MSERVSGWAGKQASERAGEQASEWAIGRAGGARGASEGSGGKRQQFLFSVHHHPNFYDFFLRAIAPFTGKREILQCFTTFLIKYILPLSCALKKQYYKPSFLK